MSSSSVFHQPTKSFTKFIFIIAFTVMLLNRGAKAFVNFSTSKAVFVRNNRWIYHSVIPRNMSNTPEEENSIVSTCKTKIMKALETKDVNVIGAYDDPNGSHISVEVVSSLFEGKRPVQRQQLVYKALWDELQGPVHAVDSMICKTPEEK
mmetsp:Transcript_22674/g.31991  ORF Transcript_22674/g.31991 Transcript_22674/m.31991 type:complete len:150 (-) Transcript_22674:96-545(-)